MEGMTTFRTGNGAAWLDLLATLSGRYRGRQVDALESSEQLRAWLRQFGLEPTARVTDADLRRTAEIREALHRTAVAVMADQLPGKGDQRVLMEVLQADQPITLQTSDGELALRRPRTVAEAMARLVRDAVQHLTGPEREQLHACGDQTCSGIFLDQSGRRRWCSDQQCGNRMRVAAYRARSRDGA